MNSLSDCLKTPVLSTENLGVPPDQVEAMAFAWLAKQSLEGLTGNLPAATGAGASVILGGIYQT
jgi:anhydro-N-acetylmuramic acid kinase